MFNAILQKTKIAKLGLVPPKPQEGRTGVAIALVVRNEAKHIGEWARFHRMAGVRQFIVYDDGCSDQTILNLQAELSPEELTVIPWAQRLVDSRLGRQVHNQVLAYAHAASNFGGAFRWMAFIDADEFLFPKNTSSISEALSKLSPEVTSISLPWHMYGRSGHTFPPEHGIIKNYFQRAADPMKTTNFKFLVDPCRLSSVRIHAMEVNHTKITWNDKGAPSHLNRRNRHTFYSSDNLQLNHYYTRSNEELEQKISRGPNLSAKAQSYRRKVMRTVAAIERETVEDFSALRFLERVTA